MRAILGLALVLAVSGCGRKEAEAPKGAAEGEVLPGSISDAMLPYDTVTSAPPLEAPEAAVRPGGFASDAAADTVVTGDEEAPPEPEAT